MGAPSAPPCWVCPPPPARAKDPMDSASARIASCRCRSLPSPMLLSYTRLLTPSSIPPCSDYCLHHSALPVMVVHRDASGCAELVLGAEATPPPITPVSVKTSMLDGNEGWPPHLSFSSVQLSSIHRRDKCGTELKLGAEATIHRRPSHHSQPLPPPAATCSLPNAPLRRTHAPLLSATSQTRS